MVIRQLLDLFANANIYDDNFTKWVKDFKCNVVTHYRRDAHLGVLIYAY